MPEPKKAKRTFDALTDSALDGLQLVPQHSETPEHSEAAPRRKKSRSAPDETEKPALVSKLIEHIRKI